MQHERRLRLFIFARIFVTFLFLVATLVLDVHDYMAISELSSTGIVRLMAFSFVFSIVSYLFSRVERYQNFIAYLQAIWDLLFVTLLLLLTGGVQSPFSFLYLLSIMNAGVLLGRRDAIYTASLCGILYGAILDLHYFGFLALVGLSAESARQVGATFIIFSILLHLVAFYLTAFITGHLYRVAKESEDALKDKSIDYEELERLNKTIVSNLESGLITITPNGNIRVFNRYAEQLTGRKQADVYNQHISTVFPDVSSRMEKLAGTAKFELEYMCADDHVLILGFGASPFYDADGRFAGTILNFKDLTTLLQMKETIKRNDRLAALGEVSARMAHEIRNPLTAMSGAVQLLDEHGSLPNSDKRLLTIILRESARLNKLITEFLAYARPALPNPVRLDLFRLVDDLCVLVKSDRKFADVEVQNLVPLGRTVLADENQLKQVLINLLFNAADARPQGGKVSIDIGQINAPIAGKESTVFDVIAVVDNGPGISAETARHMFEPFWTTKPDGTGLGLAVIYRIIEAHAGKVTVESPADGGCRVSLCLPAG